MFSPPKTNDDYSSQLIKYKRFIAKQSINYEEKMDLQSIDVIETTGYIYI